MFSIDLLVLLALLPFDPSRLTVECEGVDHDRYRVLFYSQRLVCEATVTAEQLIVGTSIYSSYLTTLDGPTNQTDDHLIVRALTIDSSVFDRLNVTIACKKTFEGKERS